MDEYIFYDGTTSKEEALKKTEQFSATKKYNSGVEKYKIGIDTMSKAQELFESGKIEYDAYKKAIDTGSKALSDALLSVSAASSFIKNAGSVVDQFKAVSDAAIKLSKELNAYGDFSEYAGNVFKSDVENAMKNAEALAPLRPVDYAAEAAGRVSISLPDADYNTAANTAKHLADNNGKYQAYIYLRNTVPEAFQRDFAVILDQIGVTADEAAILENQYLNGKSGKSASLDPVLYSAFASHKNNYQQDPAEKLMQQIEDVPAMKSAESIAGQEATISKKPSILEMLAGDEATPKAEVDAIEEAIKDYNTRDRASSFVSKNPTILDAIGEGVVSGLGQFGGGLSWYADMMQGKDTAEKLNDYRISELYSNMSGAEKMIFELTASLVNNSLSIATGAFVGGGSQAATSIATSSLFGLPIFGNDMKQALSDGKSVEEAIAYSAINTALEVGLQRVLGGIKGLSSGTAGKLISAPVKSLANKFGSTATKALSSFFNTNIGGVMAKNIFKAFSDMGKEAFEEWIQAWIDPLIKNIVYGENNVVDPFNEESLKAAILGALSAGILNTSSNVKAILGSPTEAVFGKIGQSINEGKTDLSKKEYIDLAKKVITPEMKGYDVVQRLAEGKSVSNAELGMVAVTADAISGRDTSTVSQQAEQTVEQETTQPSEKNTTVSTTEAVEANYGKVFDNNVEADFFDSYSEWRRRELNKDTTAKKVKSPGQIVNEIETLFDVPVSTGKYRGKNRASGIYKNTIQSIREAKTGDLPTVAHELGHYFDDLFQMRDWKSNKSALKKLTEIRPYWIASYPAHKRPRETVAEFFREYLSSREDAASIYPEFYTEFQDFMSKNEPKLLEKINRLGDDINRYLALEDQDRAAATIVSYNNKQTAAEMASSAMSAIQQWRILVDDKAPLLYAGQSAYERAYMAIKANGIAKGIIEGYVVDAKREVILDENGNRVAGLAWYVGRVSQIGRTKKVNGKIVGKRKAQQDFEVYLKARQNESGYKSGDTEKVLFTDPTIDNIGKTQQIIAEIEKTYPEFRELSDNLSKMYETFYRAWVVETGMMSEADYKRIQSGRDFYLPVVRKMDVTDGASTGKKASQTNRGVFRRKGGGEDTVSVIEGVARRIGELVIASESNAVRAEAANLLEKAKGGASYMEKIEPTRVLDRLTSNQREAVEAIIFGALTKEQQKALNLTLAFEDVGSREQVVADLSSEDFSVVKQVSSMFQDLANPTLTNDFSQISPFQGSDVIKIWRGGKAEYWQFHNEAFAKALGSLNSVQQVGTLVRTIQWANRNFKRFTTGLSIGFAIVRNPARDYKTGAIYGSEKNPAKYARDHFAAFKHVVQGKLYAKRSERYFKDGVGAEKKTENSYTEYLRAGGGYTGRITSDRVFADSMNAVGLWTEKTLREVLTSPITTMEKIAKTAKILVKDVGKVVGAVPRAIEAASEALEAVPRLAEYERVRKRGGSVAEAVRAADEITVNFARKSDFTKSVDLFLPYFNVSVQSMTKVVDAVIKDIQSFKDARGVGKVSAFATTTSASTVFWSFIEAAMVLGWNHLFGADEEYAKLSSYNKNNYYCLYIGNNNFLKIAKARELAVAESFFERLGERIFNKNEDAFYSFGSYFAQQWLLTGVPNPAEIGEGGVVDGLIDVGSNMLLIGGIVDVARNKDYLGRPIVPQNLTDKKASAQVDENTSYVGRFIASIFGGSPIQWDYLISSYMPTVGKILDYTADSKNITTGLTGLFFADSVYSNDAATRFYDEKETAEKEYATDKTVGQFAAASKKADSYASVMAALRTKATGDGEYEIKKALRDFTDGAWRILYENDDRLISLYEETKDATVFPWRSFGETITVEIGKKKVEKDLSADEIISNFNDYTTDTYRYYEAAFSAGIKDIAVFKRLKEIAHYNLKYQYGDNSTAVTAWVNASNAGVTPLEYAKAKVFYNDLQADENGNKIDYVNAYLDGKNFTAEQKAALLQSFGYADSTIGKYFSRDLPDWVSDILGGVA